MGIKIGNNNSIKNSTIAETINNPNTKGKKNWFERHPLITGIMAAVAAGVILMFSFWSRIIQWLEEIF